jgi:hypothetical protein
MHSVSSASPTVRNLLTRPTSGLDISWQWNAAIQVFLMCLCLMEAHKRIGHVYDQQLIDWVFVVVPAAFVPGQIWYAFRPNTKAYGRFGERFWIICMTLVLCMGMLTTR